jgi:hypothetical protein
MLRELRKKDGGANRAPEPHGLERVDLTATKRLSCTTRWNSQAPLGPFHYIANSDERKDEASHEQIGRPPDGRADARIDRMSINVRHGGVRPAFGTGGHAACGELGFIDCRATSCARFLCSTLDVRSNGAVFQAFWRLDTVRCEWRPVRRIMSPTRSIWASARAEEA